MLERAIKYQSTEPEARQLHDMKEFVEAAAIVIGNYYRARRAAVHLGQRWHLPFQKAGENGCEEH